MNKIFLKHLEDLIKNTLYRVGPHAKITAQSPVYGGDINQTFRLSFDTGEQFFVKTNLANRLSMFEAEYRGLEEMAQINAIKVPEPLQAGSFADKAYLLMEYLDLSACLDAVAFGQQLAAMHQHTADQYGWWQDNFIGSTVQKNQQTAGWPTFWARQRLEPQLHWAAARGAPASLHAKGVQLIAKLPDLLGHKPVASFVHGDLWGGNVASSGVPVLYDPAPYYGDREVDLAMTELFGSQSPQFYQAYQEAYPLPEGYMLRKTVYNLYHILNHYTLFGGSYAQQAERMIDSVL